MFCSVVRVMGAVLADVELVGLHFGADVLVSLQRPRVEFDRLCERTVMILPVLTEKRNSRMRLSVQLKVFETLCRSDF